MKRISFLICIAVIAIAGAPAYAEPAHAVKVLAVLRAHEATKHFRPPADGGILTSRFRQSVLGDSALYN